MNGNMSPFLLRLAWSRDKKMDLAIKGGKIFFEGEFIDGCVGIDEGKIEIVGKESSLPRAEEEIEAQGALVLPGFVDVEVELNLSSLGVSDLRHLTALAAIGGYTSVFILPMVVHHPSWQTDFLSTIAECGRNLACNIGLLYPLKSVSKTDISKVYKAISVRTFDLVGGISLNYGDILSMVRKLKEGRKFICYVPDPSEIRPCEERLIAKGMSKATAFITCRAASDWNKQLALCEEIVPYASSVLMSRVCSPHLYVSKRSSKVQLCLPSLYLTYDSERMQALGLGGLTDPPALPEYEISKLRKVAANGKADIFHSGHTQIELKRKEANLLPGVPSLPVSASILTTVITKESGDLTLIPTKASYHPSRAMGLINRGMIQIGYVADLTILDHKAECYINQLESDEDFPLSLIFPRILMGKVTHTICNGRLSYDASSGYISFEDGALIAR